MVIKITTEATNWVYNYPELRNLATPFYDSGDYSFYGRYSSGSYDLDLNSFSQGKKFTRLYGEPRSCSHTKIEGYVDIQAPEIKRAYSNPTRHRGYWDSQGYLNWCMDDYGSVSVNYNGHQVEGHAVRMGYCLRKYSSNTDSTAGLTVVFPDETGTLRVWQRTWSASSPLGDTVLSSSDIRAEDRDFVTLGLLPSGRYNSLIPIVTNITIDYAQALGRGIYSHLKMTEDELTPYVSMLIMNEINKHTVDFAMERDVTIKMAIEDGANDSSCNNIANAIEIVKTTAEIAKGKWSELSNLIKLGKSGKNAKLAANMWLKYRYVYNTTKLDVEETIAQAKTAIDRLMYPYFRGRAGREDADGNSHHCTIWFERAEHGDSVKNALLRLGVFPTWNNIWDMVPFSFIVDWFVPFADFAEATRLSEFCYIAEDGIIKPPKNQRFSFCGCTYSCKRTGHSAFDPKDWLHIFISWSVYNREVQEYPILTSDVSWVDDKTSTKTIFKRVVDATSLSVTMFTK